MFLIKKASFFYWSLKQCYKNLVSQLLYIENVVCGVSKPKNWNFLFKWAVKNSIGYFMATKFILQVYWSSFVDFNGNISYVAFKSTK